jgi:hypothetical protein
MYTPTPDEKATKVMIYTQSSMVRGEAITKNNVRVSTWLRTPGMPEYIHLINCQVLLFGGGAVKSLNYPEMYTPTATVIGFHIMPPVVDPLDYEANEKNRTMVAVTALVGTFMFKGQVRISSQTGIAASIEASRTVWMSIYDADVTNLHLPQMPPMRVQMALFNPKQVSFGME